MRYNDDELSQHILILFGAAAALCLALFVLRKACVICIDHCLLSDGTASVPVWSFLQRHCRCVQRRSEQIRLSRTNGGRGGTVLDEEGTNAADGSSCWLPTQLSRLAPKEKEQVFDLLIPSTVRIWCHH